MTHPTAPGKPRTMPTVTPAAAVAALVEADMLGMVVVVLVCPFAVTRLMLMLTLLQNAQARGLAGFGHGGSGARGDELA